MSANSKARHARRLCEIGFALISTPPGSKGPRHKNWNKPEFALRDPAHAEAYYTRHPDHGIAALLAPSGKVSVDVDHEEHSATILRHFGIDLTALRATTPCIVARPGRFRFMFQAPSSQLRHCTVLWQKERVGGNIKEGDLPNASLKAAETFAIFEMRAGNVADMLPPSIHPKTGQPYRWENPPRHGFPELPPRLLELWRDWPTFNADTKKLCPWAPPETLRPAPRVRSQPYYGPSVIDAFNQAHDVAAILENHGYQQRGKRFAAPDTQHAAGLVLLDADTVFCHHQGDVLGGGKPHDAFAVWCALAHGGDMRQAVYTAAKMLGMSHATGTSP